MKKPIMFGGLLAVVAIVLAPAWRSMRSSEPSDETAEVSATIVSLLPYDAIHRIGERASIIVVARSASGNIGRKRVPIDKVEGCSVGDQIIAKEQGLYLEPIPEPCHS